MTYQRIKKPCLRCGSLMSLAINRSDRKRFCSKSCRFSEGRIITKQCGTCGKPFESYRTDDRTFCSQGCYWKSKQGKPIDPKTRLKLSLALRGRKQKAAHRLKNTGPNHHDWRGGITPIAERIRRSAEYVDWRHSVFQRDNFACVFCGSRGVTLHADHILPFSRYPHLRFEITNGRTLCISCHRSTETWGRKASSNNEHGKNYQMMLEIPGDGSYKPAEVGY